VPDETFPPEDAEPPDETLLELSAGADRTVERSPAKRAADRRPETGEPPPRGAAPRTETAPVARYEMRGELGAGGVGSVANAFDRVIGREVAFKTLHRDTGGFRERFLREARVTGQLEHPNIIPVYDMGTDPSGRTFYTMRKVQGRSLGDLLADLRGGAADPSVQARVDTFLRACDAVAYAHDHGVIHRDLKPENVMVGRFGQVLVVDWGLAARVGSDEATQVLPALEGEDADRTLEGTVLGTPAYMPPEQAEGRLANVNERSDIYSLGAVLYEALTLSAPYSGGTLHEILGRVIRGELEPPSDRMPAGTISSGMEAVILRAMANNPAERHASVLELQQEVRRATAAGRMRDEIDLRRIDPSAIYSAVIGFERTHQWLGRAYLELGKPWNLTPPQVNALRIIHGSREDGVTFPDIYERLIWTDYDTRHTAARLLELGYARIEGAGDDARYFATPAGQEAAEAIIAEDPRIEAWVASSGLTDDEWRTFSDLLARIRTGDLQQYRDWRPGAPGG
jgi:serine/threonine protein kinase